jgi:hypothetical protein
MDWKLGVIFVVVLVIVLMIVRRKQSKPGSGTPPSA